MQQLQLPFMNEETLEMPKKTVKASTFFGSTKVDQGADPEAVWSAVDGSKIARLIHDAVRCGGAVSFGATRNGSAITVRCWFDGEGETSYAGDSAAMDDLLEKWSERYDALYDDLQRGSKG